MTEQTSRACRNMSIGARAFVWSAGVLLTMTLAITAYAADPDTDADGMSDDYENFFALDPSDPADAELNYDIDNLTNLQEFSVWTDPRYMDTDRDGWPDDLDNEPLSRVFIDWGNPDFTFNHKYNYTGPKWWLNSYREDGKWRNNAWHVEADAPDNTGSLQIKFNRNRLNSDIILELKLTDFPDSSLHVDLLKNRNKIIQPDLFGNLLEGTGESTTVKKTLPLEDNPDASIIKIRRGTGEIEVDSCLLYVDIDKDGLDAEQETQIGTSDNDNDTDGDTLSDYEEIFTHGTDPTNADTDGDGMPDDWEVANNLDPNDSSDADSDTDHDGLTALLEYEHNTDPDNDDTDSDGIIDGWEVLYALNPNDSSDAADDNDSDNLTALQEYENYTDPIIADTDGDGVDDGFEVQHGMTPDAVGTEDLVGLWLLDEKTGNVAADSSFYGNDGTIHGAWHVEGWAGRYGLEFDGEDDELIIADAAVYKPSEVTAALRVKFSEYYDNTVTGSAPDGKMIILAQNNPATGYAWTFYKTEHQALVAEINDSVTGKTAILSTEDGFAAQNQ